MTLKKQVGKNIKLIRKNKGITQQELAGQLGMNVQNISQIERGFTVLH